MIMTAQKVQGVAHWFNRRAPCEDAAAAGTWKGGMAAAVCDGASCCRFGRQTAEALCGLLTQTVLTNMKSILRMPQERIRGMVLRCIREAQRSVMLEHGCDAADCGCTLSLAALDSESGRYLVLQLGDGAVIGRRARDGALCQLTTADKGETAHATWLTVHADEVIRAHLQVIRGHGVDACFCTTDGLEDTFYGRNGAVAPDVGRLFEEMASSPAAGERLIEAIAGSPYQPDDDVSFSAIVMRSRRRKPPAGARRRKGSVRRKCEDTGRPLIMRASQWEENGHQKGE